MDLFKDPILSSVCAYILRLPKTLHILVYDV